MVLAANGLDFDTLPEGSEGSVGSPCAVENWSLSSQDGSDVVEDVDSHNPQYCPDCEMWLRSLTQLDDHLIFGRKTGRIAEGVVCWKALLAWPTEPKSLLNKSLGSCESVARGSQSD
jgi:hypothetical protein